MKNDWLINLLYDTSRGFSSDAANIRIEQFRSDNQGLDGNEFVRRYVDHRLRQLGVVYGTPLAESLRVTREEVKGAVGRSAVFLALQEVQAELAMEVGCTIAHCTEANVRILELLVCHALFCRDVHTASILNQRLAEVPAQGPLPSDIIRMGRRIGRRVRKRAYMAGNPLLGLPMHNSFAYGDAKTFCRLAVVYFERGLDDRKSIEKVWEFHDNERKLLLQALVGLTVADRHVGVDSRKVMMEQIKSANLPREARRELLNMLHQPPSSLAVAAAVQDDRTRDFLLEQVLLGAMLDGHLSKNEWTYIEDLAGWLGVPVTELAEVEARVVAFYEQHQDYLDMFTVGSAVLKYRQRMLERVQRAISQNLELIVDEIRTKGDLAELLLRASSGEKLDPAQWKEVRTQLVDVLRSIPSLAIFTLPGGAVLLPLVFKVLPDSFKPMAFVKRHEQTDGASKDTESGSDPLEE